jgi:hypothetical protein
MPERKKLEWPDCLACGWHQEACLEIERLRKRTAVADSLHDILSKARLALECMVELHGPDRAGMTLMALADLDRALSLTNAKTTLKSQQL